MIQWAIFVGMVGFLFFLGWYDGKAQRRKQGSESQLIPSAEIVQVLKREEP